MKKILFLVLIAIAVSTVMEPEVEDLDVVLQSTNFNWREAWDKVKGGFTKAKNWLIEKDLWEPMMKFVKKETPELARKVCNEHNIPGDVCAEIISFLLSHVE